MADQTNQLFAEIEDARRAMGSASRLAALLADDERVIAGLREKLSVAISASLEKPQSSTRKKLLEAAASEIKGGDHAVSSATALSKWIARAGDLTKCWEADLRSSDAPAIAAAQREASAFLANFSRQRESAVKQLMANDEATDALRSILFALTQA